MKYLATICLYAALFLAGCQSSVDQSTDDGAAEVSGLALAMAEAPAPQVLAVSVKPLAQVHVRAARVMDVENGRHYAPGEVIVVGDRIQSVGAPTVAPQGARIVDLGERTLLPGLIDCHTHLAYQLDAQSALRPATEGSVDAALRGAKHAAITLRAGFTTVREMGCDDFVDVALMKSFSSQRNIQMLVYLCMTELIGLLTLDL